jgi:hypothetical protein
MPGDSVLKFDDLNLKIGQIIQLHPDPKNSQERYDCMLVGCLPGDAVIVTAASDGSFPIVQEGQNIVIRVMSANGVALFPTTVLYVADVPTFMVYLDFPKAIKFKLVRSASRVDVALPVLASNLNQRGMQNVAGKITDISLGGARVELFEEGGEVGDLLELRGKFQVGEIQRRLSIRALIRSKRKSGDSFTYGLEFNEEDEEKLLILFGFIFNLMAFGSVQKVS